MVSIMFDEHTGSFLAGAMAGLVTLDDTIEQTNGDNVIAIGTRSRACRDSWTAPFDGRRRELERTSRKCRAGMSLLSTGDDVTKRGANRAAALPGGRAHTVRIRGGR